MSANELTCLAEEVGILADKAGSKIGVVCLKVRRGRGQPSEPLVVMTFNQFKKLRDRVEILNDVRRRVQGETPAVCK